MSASVAAPSFYPVFLRLAGRRVLLVGGGPVAASKLHALLDAGAQVTIVAPEIVPEIERAARDASSRRADEAAPREAEGRKADRGEADRREADRGAAAADDASVSNASSMPPSSTPPIALHRRPFAPSDLDGVWFVVAAATPEVNRAVSVAAGERQLFVNAVDDPPNATAYLGGVLRRGGVTVAISTDGHAPALAGLLREGLDALLPQDIAAWLETSRAARREWLARGVPMDARRPRLLQALNDLYARRATAAAPATAGADDARAARPESMSKESAPSSAASLAGEDRAGEDGEDIETRPFAHVGGPA